MLREGDHQERDQTFAGLTAHSLIRNLPEMFVKELLSDERVALIIEISEEKNYFVQLLACEGGQLVVECVSNNYLAADAHLTLDQQLRLIELGFSPPEEKTSPYPNFRFHSSETTDALKSCVMIGKVLTDVFELASSSKVTLVRRVLRRRASQT